LIDHPIKWLDHACIHTAYKVENGAARGKMAATLAASNFPGAEIDREVGPYPDKKIAAALFESYRYRRRKIGICRHRQG
jgi:hypothetical protein